MTEIARAAAADDPWEKAPRAADGVPHGQPVLDGLVGLLDLERIEDGIFRGMSPPGSPVRVFGGQVAGQALVAAGRTVPPERRVHSLHAYFIRGGDPSIPIVYEVDRIRDGSSFTTRRVLAIQRGKGIFALSASFQVDEGGLEHSDPMPAVPDPEPLPDMGELSRRSGAAVVPGFAKLPRPIDLRYVTDPPWQSRPGGPGEARSQVWMRADGMLPDDDLLHVCVLTYASDLTLLHALFSRHAVLPELDNVQVASLDHALWFHRPFRADDWLLYDARSPSASGARGMAEGRFYSRDGRLVATVVQEGLMRLR